MTYALGISLPAAGAALETAQGFCPAGADGSGRRGPPGGSPAWSSPATSHWPLATAAGHPVKPSPTQSCLVVPSPTINFPGETPTTRIIRGIREIRGSPNPPSQPSLATSHSPPATPIQYGLIRPNTALNYFGRMGLWPDRGESEGNPREKPIDRLTRHRVCWAVNLGD
jgi:hypothetical protein